ncbi:hypothetical protein ACIA98_08970 [Streptomyces sp. NPDC051366]|uniref:hypothetical protein n=1 Tax=Streptomyces sp. NPDC051366 TaxID=3365652 RepID=UPI00378EE793
MGTAIAANADVAPFYGRLSMALLAVVAVGGGGPRAARLRRHRKFGRAATAPMAC